MITLGKPFLRCNYPTWVLNRQQNKINHIHSTIQAQSQSQRHWINIQNITNTCNIYIVVPIPKASAKVLRMFVIKLEYKYILKEEILSGTFLWSPRTRIQSPRKVGWSIHYNVSRQVVKRNTLGSHEGPLELGLKNNLGSPPDTNMVSLLDTVSMWTVWTIKETMFIRVNNAPLQRDLDKFQLPHIWDEDLQYTPAFHLK